MGRNSSEAREPQQVHSSVFVGRGTARIVPHGQPHRIRPIAHGVLRAERLAVRAFAVPAAYRGTGTEDPTRGVSLNAPDAGAGSGSRAPAPTVADAVGRRSKNARASLHSAAL